ncbi:Enhancer of mRNA-decapping protein 4 [Apostasia shenzhenica]|uniref:Enhancer of mRNA-decapping protein 4 n=1 Tax=Apostasia shenzhenica TaxID=1088818 RepID=A0A2I0AJZ4_9ASPA|nr:Enhancer of mRNA-decapping protein 4 [Apostasia shenzhenica]
MATPGGNPNSNPNPNSSPSPPFNVQKLFKPPSPSSNPNPNTNGNSPFPPIPSTPPAPPLGAFSYPPPTPPFQHRPFLHYPQDPLSSPQPRSPVSYPAASPSPNTVANPNAGARLMALLSTASPANLETAISMPSPTSASELASPPGNPPILHTSPPAQLQTTPARLPSSKLPRGRRLPAGDRSVYDVDSRLPGELQPPQLEVTPITKYVSDPGLVLGRQIAVNRLYICYGLKLGAIRVLNINTALRSLLRGHTQKVTDMAFFAEDVPLLTSASVDGRIFVWKITEGPDESNKPQITGKIVVAVQVIGDGEPYHPRVCWHPHKQEVLVIGIGNCLLKFDTIKVGKAGHFSAEEPFRCPLDKLIEGVQLIGKHDGEITDISMSQWMTTRLVSASKDGKIKIWEDRSSTPIAVLSPHDGKPVNSAAFMTSPDRPDHIILITAGPLNRELKIWISASEEGWLLPSDCESWKCSQTLDLRSSSEPRYEEGFFNQLLVLSQASLILLANAKKNAIYALHVDYGTNPASTRLDYIADFTVTMPILSFTGTSDVSDADQIIQIYCVQTQAIQQYALDLTQCLPAAVDGEGSANDTSASIDERISEGFSAPQSIVCDLPVGSASPKQPLPVSCFKDEKYLAVSTDPENVASSVETIVSAPPPSGADPLAANYTSAGHPINPDLPQQLHGRSPSCQIDQGNSPSNHCFDNQGHGYTLDMTLDAVITTVPDIPSAIESSGSEKFKTIVEDVTVSNPNVLLKSDGKTTHLVTPSEIFFGVLPPPENSFSDQALRSRDFEILKVTAENDIKRGNVSDKVVDESAFNKHSDSDSQKEHQVPPAGKGKPVKLGISEAISFFKGEAPEVEERDGGATHLHESTVTDLPPDAGNKGVEDSVKNTANKFIDPSTSGANSQPNSAPKGKKQKGKVSQASGSSLAVPSSFASIDSANEHDNSSHDLSTDIVSQLRCMQEMLNQLMVIQKEMQKQMAEIVVVPATKEVKRLETTLGQSMEKAIKSNIDSLWIRVSGEHAKQEKAERENRQQLTDLITNCINKDLPTAVDKMIKKEIPAIAQVLTRAATPSIEKCISATIADSFQRGVADKAVNLLEKSVNTKLEATLARQVQSQIQTSGKQAIQDSLKSTLECSVIPAFDKTCKGLFEQISETFQKGLTDHTAAAKLQYESMSTQLALTLRDAINSASSITQNLANELADGQRQLLALLAAGNVKANPMTVQQSNGPLGGIPDIALSVQQIEAPLDPTKELTRLISERKFEEAFTLALQRSDVSIVSWLCSQVDLRTLSSMVPLPLSQGVLLSLLQQLSCDIGKETSRKLGWMTDVAVHINPLDPTIRSHVRPIFEQVYSQILHQRTLPTTTADEASSIRLIIHVINSVLMSCK